MMKGPLREILPIGPQRVRLRLPSGMVARKVHLLTADAAPAVREYAGRRVDDHRATIEFTKSWPSIV
jgi:hypothetical protein